MSDTHSHKGSSPQSPVSKVVSPLIRTRTKIYGDGISSVAKPKCNKHNCDKSDKTSDVKTSKGSCDSVSITSSNDEESTDRKITMKKTNKTEEKLWDELARKKKCVKHVKEEIVPIAPPQFIDINLVNSKKRKNNEE